MSETTESRTGRREIEVAYRVPGQGWKRRTFSGEVAFYGWYEKQDDDVDVRVAR